MYIYKLLILLCFIFILISEFVLPGNPLTSAILLFLDIKGNILILSEDIIIFLFSKLESDISKL